MLTIILMDMYKVNESFGFLLNRLATAMKWSFEERFKEYGLTGPQFGFMARLFEKDSQPLSNIGRSMYCDKPTITGIANRLENKGLISKVRDEGDRRVTKAVLTKEGKALKKALCSIAIDLNADVLKGFTEEEVKVFKSMLRMSLDNVLKTIEGGVINV